MLSRETSTIQFITIEIGVSFKSQTFVFSDYLYMYAQKQRDDQRHCDRERMYKCVYKYKECINNRKETNQ